MMMILLSILEVNETDIYKNCIELTISSFCGSKPQLHLEFMQAYMNTKFLTALKWIISICNYESSLTKEATEFNHLQNWTYQQDENQNNTFLMRDLI